MAESNQRDRDSEHESSGHQENQDPAQGQSSAKSDEKGQKKTEKKQTNAEKSLAAKFDSMMQSNQKLAAEIKAMTAERRKEQGPIKLAKRRITAPNFSGKCAMGTLILIAVNSAVFGNNFL